MVRLLLSTIFDAMATSKSFKTKIIHSLRKALPALILLPSVALAMSGIMAWSATGLGPEFLPRWGRGFLGSIILLPFIIACLGLLERGVARAMGSAHWILQKSVVALLTACLIESLLAAAVTVVNQGAGPGFLSAWWLAFSRALPAGIALGVFMCFYMKPKMERMRLAASSAA